MMDLRQFKRISIGGVEMKRLAIDGAEIWRRGYTNLVPTSIDTDGSVYNGTGYIDGYRLSSSGALKEQTNTATTGFIKASKNDVVRLAGLQWRKSSGYNYIVFYDDNYNLLDTLNYCGGAAGGNALERGWDYTTGNIIDRANAFIYTENDITRFAVGLTSGSDYAYIRISAYGAGANMVVTVNEEIDV